MHWLLVYWQEVRGNVYAIVPCGLVAWLWLRAKHKALAEAHRQHAEKLTRVLEHLDPEAQTDGLLDLIADRTDERTPGGVGTVLRELRGGAAASSPSPVPPRRPKRGKP